MGDTTGGEGEVVEVQSLSMHHDARHTWATPLEGGGEGMEVS